MNSVAVSFSVYTLAIMAFGLYSARFSRATSADFFLADRGLGAWVTALSASASAESGWVTLGLVGMGFKTGVGALWIIPGTLVAFLFNWMVVAPRLRRLSAQRGAITLLDVLSDRFHSSPALAIRVLGILIIVTMLTAYVAAQFTAAAKTFEATFSWDYAAGAVAAAAIVLTYTIVGGFRAVAWTDVVQAIFMIGAVAVLPWVLIGHMGGIEVLWSRLEGLQEPTLTDPFAGNLGLAIIGFLSLWLGIPLGYSGQPHLLNRFMAARDDRAARRATFISTTWVMLLFIGAVLLGIAARGWYGSLPDPEKALPLVAVQLLPGVLAGMVIAAVMAAVSSTADSQLLVSASAISHDLYVRIFKRRLTESSRVIIHRITVFFVGIAALFVALTDNRVIFHFVLYAWAGLGSAFGPALILKLLWRGTTGWGVLAGMIVGFTTTILWVEVTTLNQLVYEMVPAFVLAFLCVVLVSLFTGSRKSVPHY
jgi:sodium/proline symporter